MARRLGTSQMAVFRLESPNYGKATLSSLKRVASLFDVALQVRFVRFSAFVNDALGKTTYSVLIDPFEEDLGFQAPKAEMVTTPSAFIVDIGAGASNENQQSGRETNKQGGTAADTGKENSIVNP